MAATKLALGRQQTGTFEGDQMQRQARAASVRANSLVDTVAVLANRAYVELAADTTTASATYATLISTTITTVLARGYLLINVTGSGVHLTNQGTTYLKVVVDGVTIKGAWTTVGIGFAFAAAIVCRALVTRGLHTVALQWKTDAASARINAVSAIEEHVAMSVQESAT